MNINTDLLKPIVELVFGTTAQPEETEVEWIETGDTIWFYRFGQRHCRRIGLIVATSPETQHALVNYYEPGDSYWYTVWVGLDDIRSVIKKGGA